MAQTFRRMDSSISTAIASLESSLSMLAPPETLSTIDFEVEGGTMVLRMPLVSISVSASGTNGSIFMWIRSRPGGGTLEIPIGRSPA